MKRLPFSLSLLLWLGLLLGLTAQKSKIGALEQTLLDNRWKKRVLLLVTPSPEYVLFLDQKALLAPSEKELAARDILVLDVRYDRISATDKLFLTRKIGAHPPHFTAVLIGKDGGIKQRSKTPISPPDLIGTIDKLPMRRQEMQQQKTRKGKPLDAPLPPGAIPKT